jgi:hypothetical protein
MRTERRGGNSRGVVVWIVFAATGLLAQQAGAFGLLDFPSYQSVLGGEYKAWPLDQVAVPAIEISFAVEAGLEASLADGAGLAALNALSTWDDISSVLTYVSAGYEPVENSRTNFMSMWISGGQWEGADADHGLGANIDIMARDQDFTIIDYRGKLHGFKDSGQSGKGSLAFSVINAANSQILSVDLYLNADYDWSTDGGHFDVETVLLHESGHAIGLDHPDQAVAMGGENYDPWTFQPGKASTGVEPMHSAYWPDGICRELTEDEEGGLAFLYPGLKGDLNGDSAFRFSDVQLVMDAYLGFADPLGPQAFHNADWDGDCQLRFADVDRTMTEYLFPMATLGAPIPEPSCLLLLIGGLFTSRLGLRHRRNVV